MIFFSFNQCRDCGEKMKNGGNSEDGGKGCCRYQEEKVFKGLKQTALSCIFLV
jgi:hypothetical protein